MQLGHAVGTRPLKTHHGHKVVLQLAGLERIGQLLLVLEHPRRGFDDLMLRRDCRNLHHTTAQVAFHDSQATLARERTGYRAQDRLVEAFNRAFAPDQFAIHQERFAGVAAQAIARHGVDVFVKQTGFQQLPNQERHTTGGLEVVDIGLAVWIHVGQGRYHLGEVGHVLPGQLDTRRHGNRRHVQGVVGRTAGGVQRNDGVDQRTLVNDLAQRHEIAVLLGQTSDLMSRFASQGIAQRRVGVNERGAWQMQAHHFHQQLVGVRGAVERAGARAVVGLHLRFQQLFAAGLAFGVALAHIGFFLVGNARRHRPTRYKDGRQVTKTQRPHQQARHDLVANAQHQRRVEHIVGQRHGCGQGNHFAAQQTEFHARLALGHAVTHGRGAACELAHRANFTQGFFDLLRKVLVRLVRREHVVI